MSVVTPNSTVKSALPSLPPKSTDDFMDLLRKSVNITDVVGEYVKLRKQGGNYSGLCPFHAERSPSFSVSEKKGVFHCFGCQKGGDVISFVQEIQGISFPEAIRFLASRVGLKLPSSFAPKGGAAGTSGVATESEDELLYKLNRFTAQFYHELLFSERGTAVRQYLIDRGLTEQTMKSAYLGFAPSSWNELYDFLVEKKAPLAIAEALGLIRKKTADASGREHYDLFRDRVLFPVTDRRGRIAAFGGRLLPSDPPVDGPKYLNSTESPIFTKGRHLYGIFQAQKHIRAEDICIVVEGYMDCLALQQAGFEYTVATLGTSLSDSHVSYLKRLTTNIILVFDSDAAGRAAEAKAMETFLKQGLVVKGIALVSAKDPDEFIRAEGAEAFQKLLDHAPYLLDQRILELKGKTGSKPEDRNRALDIILQWVSHLDAQSGNLLRLQDLSEHFGVPLAVLERRVGDLRRVRSGASPSVPRPGVVPQKAVNVSAGAQRLSGIPRIPEAHRFENKFLEYTLRHPQEVSQILDLSAILEALQSVEIRDFIKRILALGEKAAGFDANILATIESTELKNIVSRILANVTDQILSAEEKLEWEDLLRFFRKRSLEARRDFLREHIRQADASGDQEAFQKFIYEFNQIQKTLDPKENLRVLGRPE